MNGKDSPVASTVCDLLDPRGSLSSALPAKAVIEVISKCRRQLKVWLEVSAVHTSTGPLCYPNLGKYASQHVAAAAAHSFLRKLEEQGNTFNPLRRLVLSVFSARIIKKQKKNSQKFST